MLKLLWWWAYVTQPQVTIDAYLWRQPDSDCPWYTHLTRPSSSCEGQPYQTISHPHDYCGNWITHILAWDSHLIFYSVKITHLCWLSSWIYSILPVLAAYLIMPTANSMIPFKDQHAGTFTWSSHNNNIRIVQVPECPDFLSDPWIILKIPL